MKKRVLKFWIFIFPVILLSLTIANSCKKTTTVTMPVVTSTSVSAITEITASSGGTISFDGGAAITARGVCWGTTISPDITGRKTSNGTGSGSFTSSLTGLTPGTVYHIRAYATNSAGTGYGNDISFTTVTALATLTTTAISAVTSTSASSGGTITADGGASVTARGVCWGATANPTVSGSKTTDGTGTGTFTSNITGLTPGTTYHIRAYTTNSAGTSYGNDVTFSTNTALSVLTTTAYSALTSDSVKSGGAISTDGGEVVTARGVCWNTSANPTISNSKTTDGTGTGSFTSNVTNLSPGTAYFLRAYATNSVGTAYGNEITFTTPPAIPTLTTAEMQLVTSTSALAGGTVTSEGGAEVTNRGVCFSTFHNPTIANFKTSLGAGAATFVSSLTGLTPGITYYLRAYATNSAGTGYGNEVTFPTLEITGTVTDVDGNVYPTLAIGTQMWMKENLKTSKLNDGTPIPLVTDNTWGTLTTSGFGWYNNDVTTYKDTYGGYYNFYTVSSGKLCPAGWRVPSDVDWTTLFSFLGGTSVAGGKLKETGTAHWDSPNTGATNDSGFTGLPGGYRFPNDGSSYGGLTQIANWWTSSQADPNLSFHKQLQYDTPTVSQGGNVKNYGRNVRCVKQ